MLYRVKITNCELYVKSSLLNRVVNYLNDGIDTYAAFRDKDLAEFVEDINKVMVFMKSEYQLVSNL